jgi:glutathione synthase/RimK-type ligase-like ATP-grasp enzyme
VTQRILFLVGDAAGAQNDNHVRLPSAFASLGWDTKIVDQDEVGFSAGQAVVRGEPVDACDLVWLVGLGRHVTFLDRMQLLATADQRRFVNPVRALVGGHGKFYLSEFMPETFASTDADELIARLDDDAWVAKPVAGSYGRGVQFVCNDEAGRSAIRALTGGRQFALLQRRVAEIERGELRTLVAAGRAIASYRRAPGPSGLTNLAAGASAAICEPTPRERELVATIARRLAADGIGFAAIDVAGDWLIEVNVANPGGLETIERLTGTNHAPAVAAALAQRRV